MKSIFEADDYKTYVLDRIENASAEGRGMRRRMAEAMGCQIAYVSHVLAGDRDFSLEQAEALARFLELRADEAEYFLLLVEHARAGTSALRKYFEKLLARARSENKLLHSRVRLKNEISEEDRATYYSSWHFQAVRMLLTIPQYQSAKAIAKKLEIDLERANEVLGFLLKRGLAIETPKGYETTNKQIHLGADSPLTPRLHSNWRVHTLGRLDRKNEADLHYSAAVTLSHEDYSRVREIFVEAILKSHDVIKPSKEERLCVMAMDFYEV